MHQIYRFHVLHYENGLLIQKNIMNTNDCCNGNNEKSIEFQTNVKQRSKDCGCDSVDINCCVEEGLKKEKSQQTTMVFVDDDCGCGCDCGNEGEKYYGPKEVDYTIQIDGKKVRVSDASKNIVQIAKEAGIPIPAPCFYAKKKNGCCNGCVVEIENEQHFACGTRAKENMNVIVNREDLIQLRKERLLEYKKRIKNGNPQKCSN